MKHYHLTAAQSAANCGFTDLYVITHDDLTETALNTDQVLTLDRLDAGEMVAYGAFAQVITPFTGNTSDNTCVASVGVIPSPNEFVPGLTLVSGGSPAQARYAASSASTGAPWVETIGTDIIATFNITDPDGALDGYTAGELRIWLKVLRRPWSVQV